MTKLSKINFEEYESIYCYIDFYVPKRVDFREGLKTSSHYINKTMTTQEAEEAKIMEISYEWDSNTPEDYRKVLQLNNFDLIPKSK